ncbi:hypothetical protein BU16DRAFT_528611 [Lophium mytilinum]|uniref:Uncharacterized protein n=1 Tax=Lophium mytilinum TaxID=390894 RepID=A0A6A6QMI4_9PEZI|nr:hypothetical protein BU16DRAFT_528611 [Lophium mytilinum]
MPIRKSKTTITPTSTAPQRTGAFAANSVPPPYVPNSALPTPRALVTRDTYATPSLNRDLEYFHAIAAGEYAGPIPVENPMLVLNLFRATLTHIQPIAERLTLGPAQGAPYYALNTTPSTTSTDEFNILVVTRRHPVTGVYSPACTAEIQPKLNLDVPGVRCVAVLTSKGEQKSLSYGDQSSIGDIGDCYGLYHRRRNVSDSSTTKIPLAFLYADESWRTLEQLAEQRSIIYAKRPAWGLDPTGRPTGEQADPRSLDARLAYLDFQQVVPQLVSADREAHAFMERWRLVCLWCLRWRRGGSGGGRRWGVCRRMSRRRMVWESLFAEAMMTRMITRGCTSSFTTALGVPMGSYKVSDRM